MLKLLILAYDFPPYVSVGGLRPYSWFKYLHEFGVYPVVITRQWSNRHGSPLDYVSPGESDKTLMEETPTGTLVRSPYRPTWANRLILRYGEHRFRFLRKAISAYYELIQWILPIGPKYELYRAADSYLKTHRVDCIIATGDPFILFRYAAKLSEKYSVPWIADYRDPWVEDKNLSPMKPFYALMEKRYVSKAVGITTVTDFFIHAIRKNFPQKSVELIYNGYDPENFDFHRNESRNPMLTLSFAGTLNPWHPLELFLQEVNRFCSHEKIPVRLQFFGVNQPERVVAFQSQAVNHLHIEIYPKMPNSELIKVLSGSDGLILFNDYYYIGTKIFDYLALQKRILFCFSDDKEALGLKERFYHLSQLDGYDQIPQIELIRQTESGVVVRDREHLYETLKEWGREFSATGQLTCRSSGYEFYSRKNQTKRLAEVIHQHISPKL